jgi:hypothetical protein
MLNNASLCRHVTPHGFARVSCGQAALANGFCEDHQSGAAQEAKSRSRFVERLERAALNGEMERRCERVALRAQSVVASLATLRHWDEHLPDEVILLRLEAQSIMRELEAIAEEESRV